MSPGMEVHQKIKLLLEFSVQMEELIRENREELSFPAADAQKFAHACKNMLTLHASLANHFAEEGTDLLFDFKVSHVTAHRVARTLLVTSVGHLLDYYFFNHFFFFQSGPSS